jgi:hypothetical protein
MRSVLITALAATVIGVASPAAAAVTFSGTGTAPDGASLAASATFDVVGGHLIVSLTNTAPGDVNSLPDVLHALFFDVSGNPALSYTSGTICSGCSFTQTGVGAPTGTDIGAEWGYITNPVGGGLTQHYGLSSAGYGIGSYTFAPGAVIQPHKATQPDGPDYGLVTAGYSTAGDSGGMGQNQPFINDGVVLDLGAFNGQLSSIGNIRFQYGTDISADTHFGSSVPEPATWGMMLLGFGGIGIAMRRRRKPANSFMQIA